MIKYLLIFYCVAYSAAFAQTLQEPVDYIKIYNKGIELYQNEKYEEALSEFEKVDRNDSIYADALLQRSVLYYLLGYYDKALPVCEEGIALNSSNSHYFYTNLGVSLNMLKRPEDAIAVLDKGIKLYPKNHLLYFNKGVVYRGMGKAREATEMFKASLLLNPYYVSNHLNLAIIAAEEGKVSQAMLSFATCILLEPDTERSFSILKRLNDIVSSKYERNPANIKLSDEGDEDFEELDLIITNYAALSKDFKIPVKIDVPAIKQLYVLLTKMEFNKNDKGFWMQTYVPLYKEIITQNKFPAFAYYCLQPSKNEVHVKLVNKNMSHVKQFAKWVPNQLDNVFQSRLISFNGKMQEVRHVYNSRNHNLEVMGVYNKEKKAFNGYTEIYHSNGAIKSKGEFQGNEEKEGLWQYFDENGRLTTQSTYSKNLAHGPFKAYWPDGTLKREGSYLNGKQDGVQKEYFRNGKLEALAYFKDDDFHGDYTSYYEVGDQLKHYAGKYSKGKVVDTVFEYYDNGKLASFKIRGQPNIASEYRVYFKNGQLASQSKLLNNEYEGKVVFYDWQGRVGEEKNYKDGNPFGEWKSYEAGILKEEAFYDEKGRKTGTLRNYDSDGVLHAELTYNEGVLVAYKYLDKNGRVIKEDKNSKGEYSFTGFSPAGLKAREGKLLEDKRNGLWKFYDEYGNMVTEENYNEKGQLHGKAIHYHKNGAVEDEINYVSGVKDGIYLSFYSNGKLKQEGWFKNGNRQGYWHAYQADGSYISRRYFLNDELSGYQQYFRACGKVDNEDLIIDGMIQKTIFYDLGGEISSIVDLPNGTGKFITKYDNNNTKLEKEYVLGIAHGKVVSYHYDGKVKTQGQYFNGSADGQWTWYHENGRIQLQGKYEDGEKEGKWISNYANGKARIEENFVNGSKEGERKIYYDNGKLMVQKFYRNDKEEGKALYYDETGALQYAKIYDKGIVVAYTYHDAKGEFVGPVDVSSGTYKVVAFFKNGKKSVEYNVVKGDYQGEYIEYFSNGNILEKINYSDNSYHGLHQAYYPDGKLKFERSYSNDALHGLSKYYYPDGKLESEQNFIFGNLDGESKFYDKNGKIIKRVLYDDDEIVKQVNL